MIDDQTRTYGRLRLATDENGKRWWGLEARPDVAIRVKRILPRVQQNVTGRLVIADTLDLARDLAWIVDRWPMLMDADAAAYLAERDAEHRARTDQVMRILAGHTQPGDGDELLTLARPARQYQEEAAELAYLMQQLLLVDELGLGKTFSAYLLLRRPLTLPALFVTETHLPPQMLAELANTLPDLHGHVVTTGGVYDPAKTRASKGRDPDVLFISYSKLQRWADHLAGRVRTVIFDEAQALRRRESERYQAAAMIAHAADFRMGLTATPVYNYGSELWSILNVIAPGVLGSRDEFLREWCSTGGEKAMVSDPAALSIYLREQGIMLGRTREEVKRELPGEGRPIQLVHTVDVDVDELDAATADAVDLAEMILAGTSHEKGDVWRASGDLDWRLRHATGLAKAKPVAQFADMLLETGEPIVLWGWHHDVYDEWANLLARHQPAFYTGRQTPKQKEDAKARFIEGKTNLLIMSLRSGTGVDGLQTRAKVGIFGELDWAAGVHKQCIGRLYRDGQTGVVVAYYVVADHGSDPVIAETLDLKTQQAAPIENPYAERLVRVEVDVDRVKLLATDFLRRRGRLPDQPEAPPADGTLL